MKTVYDSRANTILVQFTTDAITASVEVRPGVEFSYDEAGKIVGIEIRDAKERLESDLDLVRLIEHGNTNT